MKPFCSLGLIVLACCYRYYGETLDGWFALLVGLSYLEEGSRGK